MARVTVILDSKILICKLMTLLEATTYVVNWRMHHPLSRAEIELEFV